MYDPVFAAILLFIATGLLLNYYRSPDTPLIITLVIYVAWFLGFSGILLLPFDLAEVQVGRPARERRYRVLVLSLRLSFHIPLLP